VARYKGRSDTHAHVPEIWETVYLEVLSKRGNMSTAAKMAGTTNRIVKARRDESPEFNAQWMEAMDAYLDSVEEDLGALKNPIAKIARLRADRPDRYLEKHQLAVAGTILNAHFAPPPDEINSLLQAMVKSMAPESRAQIVEGSIKSLPPESTDEPAM
jgi:hypothetical protein